MAQETTEQKLVKRVKADIDGGLHSTELILAQIASNKAVRETLSRARNPFVYDLVRFLATTIGSMTYQKLA